MKIGLADSPLTKEDLIGSIISIAPSSSDLAPIENCWQSMKQHVRKYSHWDDDSLEKLIREGWRRVSQEFINEKVRSMPKRLEEVIRVEGAMIGY